MNACASETKAISDSSADPQSGEQIKRGVARRKETREGRWTRLAGGTAEFFAVTRIKFMEQYRP